MPRPGVLGLDQIGHREQVLSPVEAGLLQQALDVGLDRGCRDVKLGCQIGIGDQSPPDRGQHLELARSEVEPVGIHVADPVEQRSGDPLRGGHGVRQALGHDEGAHREHGDENGLDHLPSLQGGASGDRGEPIQGRRLEDQALDRADDQRSGCHGNDQPKALYAR